MPELKKYIIPNRDNERWDHVHCYCQWLKGTLEELLIKTIASEQGMG